MINQEKVHWDLNVYDTSKRLVRNVQAWLEQSEFKDKIKFEEHTSTLDPTDKYFIFGNVTYEEEFEIEVSCGFIYLFGGPYNSRKKILKTSEALRTRGLAIEKNFKDNYHAIQESSALLLCDLIEPNLVGSMYIPLIATVPLPVMKTHAVALYEPKNLIFHNCIKNPIQHVKFDFLKPSLDLSDLTAVYQYFPLSITLLFRKRTLYMLTDK
jgi:hypothetical protein